MKFCIVAMLCKKVGIVFDVSYALVVHTSLILCAFGVFLFIVFKFKFNDIEIYFWMICKILKKIIFLLHMH